MKERNNDIWKFCPSYESLEHYEKGEVSKETKVSHEVLFYKVSNEIQSWFGFMAIIFDSVGQEWSH